MLDSLLLFSVIGEDVARLLLRGWCGPLVPEPRSEHHDHTKLTLTYTDATTAHVSEGHLLMFSQVRDGIVFQETPEPGVQTRCLSWATCWRWVRDAGLDLARPEVSGRVAQVLGTTLCDEGRWPTLAIESPPYALTMRDRARATWVLSAGAHHPEFIWAARTGQALAAPWPLLGLPSPQGESSPHRVLELPRSRLDRALALKLIVLHYLPRLQYRARQQGV